MDDRVLLFKIHFTVFLILFFMWKKSFDVEKRHLYSLMYFACLMMTAAPQFAHTALLDFIVLQLLTQNRTCPKFVK